MLKRYALALPAAVLAMLIGFPTHARAQFTPRSVDDPATGERYHIEGAIGLWTPTSTMTLSSEGLGIAGTLIDAKRDLGLTDQRFPEIQAVLRPFKKHKLRFQYIPIDYTQQSSLIRDVVFNGQRYRVGLPVNSELNWKAFRFAYEYDAFYTNRGFIGLILDAKYTDVGASLRSPVNNEKVKARAPIPAIGGIARVYVVPNISITGELTGASIPNSLAKRIETDGHYFDVDVYGTVNLTNNVGVKVGFRRFDVAYDLDDDAGNFVLQGLYFGAVARF